MKQILSTYLLGDMQVSYIQDHETKAVGIELVPAEAKGNVVPKNSYSVEPCVQLKLVGDNYPNGFSQGRTMRGAETTSLFHYDSQVVEVNPRGDSKTIITCFSHENMTRLEHRLIWHQGYDALEIHTVFHNRGTAVQSLEMLSSFSLGGLTPFAEDEGTGRLILHRLRSTWSMEGRLESVPAEKLQLEPSWQRYSSNSLRFGQVGSMPVREFFPFAAVEDTEQGVTWGVQVAYAGSWQLEVYRKDNGLSLSGGLADRELGHWLKHVAPGESFAAPAVFLTAASGGIDEAAHRLTTMHELPLRSAPHSEQNLPIIFNEFCTTWGSPSAEQVMRIADRLQGKGIEYLVIDCGWYSEEGKNWERSMGDWVPNPELFPEGIGKVADYIRSRGMIPGIWFEIEICGHDAAAFHFTEHLLKRDGIPITTGIRRFWDMRDPWTIEYLTVKVTGMIKEHKFGYLKIDYNDTIGIGCDGAESLGEGLRAQIEAVQLFISTIKAEVPQLVIENCSSGGHRLEPSMLGLTSMSSFSDAHEELEIPIIAANLHRALLPRQNQIWAVLRKSDTAQRIVYSLAATFLGRMCLSGDIEELSSRQWALIDAGIAFYKQAVPVIRHGITYRHGPEVFSYRQPEGWQAIIRVHKNGASAMVVIHTFGGSLPDVLQIPLHEDYRVTSIYAADPIITELSDGLLKVQMAGPFQALALFLER